MPPYSLVINSVGSSVIVRSNYRSDIKKIKTSLFLKRYIPSVVVLDSNTKFDCELILKRGRNKIEMQYPRAIYHNFKFAERDIVSLVEYLLERARQQAGLYCIHGSACVVSGQAVIFWGGVSGLGKTSLCKKMQADYGAKWLADEKIVIDFLTNQIKGWVDVAYLKKKRDKFQQLQSVDLKTIPIAFFVCPLLTDDSCSGLIFDRWPSKKFRWHLFEESNRKIRATSKLLFSETEPIMPIDTPNLAKGRIRAVKKIVAQSSNYFIKGNSDNICKKVIYLLKNKNLSSK